MTRAALIFFSGGVAGVLGTLAATHRRPAAGAPCHEGPAGVPGPAARARPSKVPRLTWPPAQAAASVCPPPTRQACEQVMDPPDPPPGTPEYYRACATRISPECSFVDLHPEAPILP
jgi:hypothetical protein